MKFSPFKILRFFYFTMFSKKLHANLEQKLFCPLMAEVLAG